MEMSYSITDLEGFARTLRNGAATSLCEGYTDNIDEYITISQIIKLIDDHHIGVDNVGDYLITENIFDTIFETVRCEIYQSALSKLASKNVIQCAWDSEKDTMVFWLDKENELIPISQQPNT